MMNDNVMCARLPAFCLRFSVPVIQVGFYKFPLVRPVHSLFFARVPLNSSSFACVRGSLYTAGVGGGQGNSVMGLFALIWQI